MRLGGKTNLAVPGESSGTVRFSALRAYWRLVSFYWIPTATAQNQPSFPQVADRREYPAELRSLIRTLNTVRQRVLANTLLRGWTRWAVCILIGLIAIAAALSKLVGALLVVGVLGTTGAAAILIWTWRNRLSAYEAAQRLDSAAGLKDRLPTAIYLGGIDDPDGLIAQQRKDALTRAAKVDPRGLFPVRLPASVGRALILILVVAGLFAYRINHKPPLLSLLQSATRSQLVQSIFSPLIHAMEKDLQRTIALVTMKPDSASEEARRDDSALSSEDLWKGDEKGNAKDEQQQSADAGDEQDQLQAPSGQDGAPSPEARQEEASSQSQDDNNGNESASGNSKQQAESPSAEKRQSLGQSLMQALKNMLSNSSNQQANNRANQQPSGQGTPQSGNSHQPGATEGDKRGESRGSSDAKQKATQTASEGAGSQQGSKELHKDPNPHPFNAVPDRVALEASGFKEQTRMNVQTETGTAQLASRNQSPQGDAVVNGAEQETIPARYRLYVQRYFEHTNDARR